MLGFVRLRKKQPPYLRPVLEYAVDNWIGRAVAARGWFGSTIPLGFCVVVLYWRPPAGVLPLHRVHEHTHVRQAFRRGPSWIQYAVAFLRCGYRDNPLEAEAYEEQRRAREKGLPDWARE